MGYYIKIEELMEVQQSIMTKIQEWNTGLGQIYGTLEILVGSSAMQGNTGDSIRNYISEVHIPIIVSLQQMLQEYQMRLSIYASGHYGIEESYQGKIPQEQLEKQMAFLRSGESGLEVLQERTEEILRSIDDLIQGSWPSIASTRSSYEALQQQVRELHETIGNHEETHKRDVDTVSAIMNSVYGIIHGTKGDANMSVTQYQGGSLSALPVYKDLITHLGASEGFVTTNQKEYQEGIERFNSCLNDRLADERTEDGFLQILAGTASVIAGAVLIVATAGMATPIVVGALVVGSTSMMYGLSNSYEGMDNVALGFAGDGLTAAQNPIRDTYFASNPDLYYAIGNASTMISALAVPIGGAGSAALAAGTSPLRAMAVESGKIVISGVVGEKSAQLIYQQTDSKIGAALGGGLMGGLAYGGLGVVDRVANVSGLYRGSPVDSVAQKANVVKDSGGDQGSRTTPVSIAENKVSGMEWYEYFRKTYGKENVCWENVNSSEVAQAWQGSYPYVGVDDYINVTLKNGDIVWMGEPYPTGYSTTTEAVGGLGKDAQGIFGRLQVKPYYEKGMGYAEYRGELTPYRVNRNINVAEGLAKKNPQFGGGGALQRFDPNFDYNVANGTLTRLDDMSIKLTNTKISLEEYFRMMDMIE